MTYPPQHLHLNLPRQHPQDHPFFEREGSASSHLIFIPLGLAIPLQDNDSPTFRPMIQVRTPTFFYTSPTVYSCRAHVAVTLDLWQTRFSPFLLLLEHDHARADNPPTNTPTSAHNFHSLGTERHSSSATKNTLSVTSDRLITYAQ